MALAPSHVVVAVGWVVDGADDDTSTERLDPLRDLVKPAQDRARELAEKQVVAAGGECHEIRSRRRASEVGEHAVRPADRPPPYHALLRQLFETGGNGSRFTRGFCAWQFATG
jgi:hypothetical protein